MSLYEFALLYLKYDCYTCVVNFGEIFGLVGGDRQQTYLRNQTDEVPESGG